VVTVLVTPLPSPQEIDSVDAVRSLCLHVANVHVGRSNRLTRFEREPLLRQGFVYSIDADIHYQRRSKTIYYQFHYQFDCNTALP
jgi:hypothetical protein